MCVREMSFPQTWTVTPVEESPRPTTNGDESMRWVLEVPSVCRSSKLAVRRRFMLADGPSGFRSGTKVGKERDYDSDRYQYRYC